MSEPDANLTAALAAINAEVAQEATAPATAAALDYDAIVIGVMNDTLAKSDVSGNAYLVNFLNQVFTPALLSALKKG